MNNREIIWGLVCGVTAVLLGYGMRLAAINQEPIMTVVMGLGGLFWATGIGKCPK